MNYTWKRRFFKLTRFCFFFKRSGHRTDYHDRVVSVFEKYFTRFLHLKSLVNLQSAAFLLKPNNTFDSHANPNLNGPMWKNWQEILKVSNAESNNQKLEKKKPQQFWPDRHSSHRTPGLPEAKKDSGRYWERDGLGGLFKQKLRCGQQFQYLWIANGESQLTERSAVISYRP